MLSIYTNKQVNIVKRTAYGKTRLLARVRSVERQFLRNCAHLNRTVVHQRFNSESMRPLPQILDASTLFVAYGMTV